MSASSLAVCEDAAAAVQKTENRVTLASIKAKVAHLEYLRPSSAPHFTIAVVRLENGFVVTGESACADPANYNRELGESLAFESALRKVWALEGYLLCEKIAQQ